MVKFIKYLFLSIIYLTFSGCGAGIADFTEDLGGGYFYNGEGSESNYVYLGKKEQHGYSIDTILVYPQVDCFAYDEYFILLRQKPSLKGHKSWLGSRIQSCANIFRRLDSLLPKVPASYQSFYKDYAKDSIFYREVASQISSHNTIEDQEFCRMIADSIIKDDPYYQKIYSRDINYWIIEKNVKKLHGPYSQEEYINRKEELKVPEDLKLDK